MLFSSPQMCIDMLASTRLYAMPWLVVGVGGGVEDRLTAQSWIKHRPYLEVALVLREVKLNFSFDVVSVILVVIIWDRLKNCLREPEKSSQRM